MATISKRRRADGQFRYQVTIRKKGFSSLSKSFTSKRDAQAWARRMESDMELGEVSQGSLVYTFSDLCGKYREHRIPQLKSARCRERHLTWWEQRIGDTKLGRLTRSRIKECLSELREGGMNGTTVNRYRASLQATLAYGVNQLEWLRDNPVAGLPKEPEPRGRVRFLSDDERERLLTECKCDPDLYLVVLIALTTGARQSEIMSIRWSDIDMKERTVHIQHTKNQEPRVLPLAETVMSLLRERPRAIGKHDWLFPSNQLRKDHRDYPRHGWEKAVEAAGLHDFRFHDLRHTAASYLAQAGVSTRQLADMLGHKTLAMTLRYSHLTVESRRGLVDLLDAKVK